jgi:hypothetical protein
MTTPATTKKLFGAGRPFLTSNTSPVPTPLRLGLVQDQSVDFKSSVKAIYGENRFAEAIANAESEVTGKTTMGTTSARLFADYIAGTGSTAGQTLAEADGELGTVPATPFQVTVVNSSTFVADLGVTDKTNGARLVRITGTPVLGQYAEASGVYTFPAATTGHQMAISYLWNATPGAGETVIMTNSKMGSTNPFMFAIVFPWQDASGVEEQDIFQFNWCLVTDHSWSTKIGDWGKPTLGYTMGCDNSGVLGTASFAYAN